MCNSMSYDFFGRGTSYPPPKFDHNIGNNLFLMNVLKKLSRILVSTSRSLVTQRNLYVVRNIGYTKSTCFFSRFFESLIVQQKKTHHCRHCYLIHVLMTLRFHFLQSIASVLDNSSTHKTCFVVGFKVIIIPQTREL